MKILDTAMTEIVKGNSARYYSKYVVDGKEHIETLNNFKFLNMINPNNEITIGNTCSSSVTFSIYMPAISLENKGITIFEGVKVGTEIKYIKLGIFTVTKQTSDGEYTSYEAYDRMYKADMPYLLNKLVINCIRRKIKLVIENPYNQPHYLTTYWCLKPDLIDKDRTQNGDYYKKPTQYWFVNFKPKNNLVFEAIDYVKTKIIAKSKVNDDGLSVKTQRSMIHPQYADRFIKQYILDEEIWRGK